MDKQQRDELREALRKLAGFTRMSDPVYIPELTRRGILELLDIADDRDRLVAAIEKLCEQLGKVGEPEGG